MLAALYRFVLFPHIFQKTASASTPPPPPSPLATKQILNLSLVCLLSFAAATAAAAFLLEMWHKNKHRHISKRRRKSAGTRKSLASALFFCFFLALFFEKLGLAHCKITPSKPFTSPYAIQLFATCHWEERKNTESASRWRKNKKAFKRKAPDEVNYDVVEREKAKANPRRNGMKQMRGKASSFDFLSYPRSGLIVEPPFPTPSPTPPLPHWSAATGISFNVFLRFFLMLFALDSKRLRNAFYIVSESCRCCSLHETIKKSIERRQKKRFSVGINFEIYSVISFRNPF